MLSFVSNIVNTTGKAIIYWRCMMLAPKVQHRFIYATTYNRLTCIIQNDIKTSDNAYCRLTGF